MRDVILISDDEKYNTQKNPVVFHRPKKIPSEHKTSFGVTPLNFTS